MEHVDHTPTHLIPQLRQLFDAGEVPAIFRPHVQAALSKPTLDRAYEHLKSANQLTGGGLMSWIAQKFSTARDTVKALWQGTRMDYPPAMRNLLPIMGNAPISAIEVGRTPVGKHQQALLNLVSQGKFNEEKAKMPYDDLFHVFIIIFTTQGNYLLEKNASIELFPYTAEMEAERRKTPGSGFVGIPMTRANGCLQPALDLAQRNMGSQAFFTYDAFTNNCQVFLMAVLNAMNQLGFITLTANVQQFIFQDVAKLAQNLSAFSKHFARAVTDTAHRVHIFLKGRGFDFNQHHANQVSKVLDATGPYTRRQHIEDLEPDSTRAMWELSNSFDSKEHDFLRTSVHPQQYKARLSILNEQAAPEFWNNFMNYPAYERPLDEEEMQAAENQGLPFTEFIDGYAINPNDLMNPVERAQAIQDQTDYYIDGMMPDPELDETQLAPPF